MQGTFYCLQTNANARLESHKCHILSLSCIPFIIEYFCLVVMLGMFFEFKCAKGVVGALQAKSKFSLHN